MFPGYNSVLRMHRTDYLLPNIMNELQITVLSYIDGNVKNAKLFYRNTS